MSVPRGVAERLEAGQRSLHDGIALPYVLVSHPKTRDTDMNACFVHESMHTTDFLIEYCMLHMLHALEG